MDRTYHVSSTTKGFFEDVNEVGGLGYLIFRPETEISTFPNLSQPYLTARYRKPYAAHFKAAVTAIDFAT